jgi:hypothetical protein
MELDKHVRTNNNIETTKGNYGVCISMTTQWISACKSYGEVTRDWQIGQRVGDENIIHNAGLTIASEIDDPSLADIATEGFHILSIWNAPGNQGHSMGTRVTDSSFQFFDPNFGLYHAKNVTGLIADVADHCRTYYPTLNAEYISRRIS